MARPIVGYGEDALTFWAVSEGLPKLLTLLGGDDRPLDTNVENCLVFYRPSFARGSGFGEFDAILATFDQVFLIESKWHPPERHVPLTVRVKLKDEQVKRHQIWTKYWQIWNQTRQSTKAPESLLDKHLDYVFQRIGELQRNEAQVEIVNILLYFIPLGRDIPNVIPIHARSGLEISSFKGIGMAYPPLNSFDGFVGLPAHSISYLGAN